MQPKVDGGEKVGYTDSIDFGGGSMKTMNTAEYISMLRELLAAGQTVNLPVAGNSMLPFLIHNRDSVTLKFPDRPVTIGDIALYQRPTGEYILHRVCRMDSGGFYAVGDAQQLIEGPLDPGSIFGIVISARRKGKTMAPGGFWWEFFEHVWIRLIPLRHRLMRLWGIRIPDGKGAHHE